MDNRHSSARRRVARLAAGLAVAAALGLPATTAFADGTADEGDEDLVKIETPTVAKQVLEGDEWSSSADAGACDAVSFKVTGTLPSNWDEFDFYYYAFHDEPDEALEPQLDTVGVSLVLADGDEVDVTDAFEASFSDSELIVECADLKAVAAFDAAGSDSLVVLTYDATIDAAALGTGEDDAATNDAWIVYTSKAFTDALGKSTTAETLLYSWAIELHKVDEDGEALAGATFTVLDVDAGLYLAADGTGSASPVELAVDEDGLLVVSGVDAGTYLVTEVSAPEGYEECDPFALEISSDAASGSPRLNAVAEVEDDGTQSVEVDSTDDATGVVALSVVDEEEAATSTSDLAQTGSAVLVAAVALAALGAVLVLASRRARTRDRDRYSD